ncbi:MAG TPA: polyprenyl synthetase family protein [Alphaproteobacteria bacterium]|nr:polyprenyl synthetase family protein [Alphaproteobacteria bacterium]HJN60803.1 polyprenyl synthetase family protein [Alphaproteobacteria bacterium]
MIQFDSEVPAAPEEDATLDQLQALVAEDLREVNRVILEYMNSDVALIPTLAGHIIASGGKRLRPILTLAVARMCGYSGTRHISLAACVEFIHTATLLHDDVVDESDLRRGAATANAVWGNKPSVLVGDFLFSRAFQLSVADGSLKVLAILANTSAVLAEGEVMQLLTSNDTETSEAAYLDVITAKTATLFAAACQLGGVVAERPANEEEGLKNYGINLGIAYQLVDDALDYSAREKVLGKSIGDDFREGKITLPVVLSFRRGGEEERKFWRRTMEEGEQTGEDFERAVMLIERHGAIQDTLERARHYGAVARDALAIFPVCDEKKGLLDVIDFCIRRAH